MEEIVFWIKESGVCGGERVESIESWESRLGRKAGEEGSVWAGLPSPQRKLGGRTWHQSHAVGRTTDAFLTLRDRGWASLQGCVHGSPVRLLSPVKSTVSPRHGRWPHPVVLRPVPTPPPQAQSDSWTHGSSLLTAHVPLPSPPDERFPVHIPCGTEPHTPPLCLTWAHSR